MLAITHDFKAPLGSIMGYADLLSRLTVDERQRFYLDNMKTSSEHLLSWSLICSTSIVLI